MGDPRGCLTFARTLPRLREVLEGVAGHFDPLPSHQHVPGTTDGLLQPGGCRNQNIGLSRLDLLEGANVQVSGLGQLLLRDLAGHSLAAQVVAEAL